jgi:outer membrane lipoprotein-sorting protein
MKDRLQLKFLAFLILILKLLLLGCTSKEYSSNTKKYVIQAFDSIEVYSRHRLTFNFDSLETQVLKKIQILRPTKRSLNYWNQPLNP